MTTLAIAFQCLERTSYYRHYSPAAPASFAGHGSSASSSATSMSACLRFPYPLPALPWLAALYSGSGAPTGLK